MNSDITNPLMDSSTEKNYRETTNQENPPSRSSKREESKERISMGEYDEELLNNSVQEDFFFDAGERRIVSVNAILKPNALYINLLTNEDKPENWYFHPKDLVGASVVFPLKKIRFSQNEMTEVYELKIYYFSKIKRACSKKCFRLFSEKTLYHSNIDMIKKWSDLILNTSKDKEFLKNLGIKPIDMIQIYTRKKLLILVNPTGGSGMARQICNRVSPELEKSGYELEVLSTQYYKHAYEYVKNMDQNKLLTFFAIVTISGDGLSHEVINGLFHREDWEKVKEIAVGFIPGGSANAMSKNVCNLSKEECLLENIVYIMAKGEKREIDVIKFEIEGEETVYGILSVCWALLADVDLESEVIRCCGGARFTMWAAIRWFILRRYHAKLSYTCQNVNLKGFGEIEANQNEAWVHLDEIFVHFFIGNVPFLTQTDNFAPMSKLDDGFMDIQFMCGRENVGRWKTLKYLLRIDSKGSIINFEEGKPWHNSGLEYHKIKAFRLEPYGDSLGNYSIDGERYPAKKMQGMILPKAIKIISL